MNRGWGRPPQPSSLPSPGAQGWAGGMGQWDRLRSSCHAPNDLPSSAKAHVSACDQGVYLPGTDRPSETPGLPGQGWPERGHVPQPRCQAGAEPAEGEGVMGSPGAAAPPLTPLSPSRGGRTLRRACTM